MIDRATGYSFTQDNKIVLIDSFGRWLHNPIDNDKVTVFCRLHQVGSFDAIKMMLNNPSSKE